ncbi:uncharacterized protein BO66DRAFT_80589 [Aspergillus aculeatinus CBS 121060]|uniref:Uncharacterized protein n=1 Tax=Aspergillus aculeatinus CBS 121060 TaxID=1448322 RepID=A0ACD1HB62_9EURO|nr:hypothetical protein BO66DRAFT_80589 [Aspergillus aculeatinus CBS 121060]RAH70773.1 hypothetical protein BO66DRAFT_80589 [Aspergillus aculeatinus CBS 121060]
MNEWCFPILPVFLPPFSLCETVGYGNDDVMVEWSGSNHGSPQAGTSPAISPSHHHAVRKTKKEHHWNWLNFLYLAESEFYRAG